MIITISEPPQYVRSRRSLQEMARLSQGLQRRAGVSVWLPSGETISGHPLRCIRLTNPPGADWGRTTAPKGWNTGMNSINWRQPVLHSRALRLPTSRFAESVITMLKEY